MSIFTEIADQHSLTDAALETAVENSYEAGDEPTFERAWLARQRNDQAYYLYLFTRFEAEVNRAVSELLARKASNSIVWSERRIWEAWSRPGDIAFMSKVGILTEKGRQDYNRIRDYYDGRNMIAHGGDWNTDSVVQSVAEGMRDIVRRFATI